MLAYTPKWQNAANPEGTNVYGTSPAPEQPKGKAWSIIDNILGVTDKVIDIRNEIKNPGGTGGTPVVEEKKFLGMPMALGITVTVIGTLVIGVVIYKLVKK
jgi:hypothetical protein